VDPASDDDVSPNENSPTVRTNGPETVFAPSTSCVSDEARLSRARGPAVLQEVSPPPSPPETMVTPPRRNSSNASRLEFPTPPRPHDLPDLPELPSTSEEDVTVDGPRANGGTHLVDSLKTPKPPGAWAGTPAPARERAQSASDEVEDAHRDSGLATPMSSLSRARAGSLPMQTPAPPGAWTGTPGTADRRKSILKVRFDVESEQSMSEGVGGARADGTVDFNPFAAASSSDPEPFDIPTPVSPRSPRKSAGIRVVDAFGREQQGYGKDADEDVGSPNVSRSKGAIRIVDAMGREVDDVAHAEPVAGEHAQANEPPPMSHREALVRVGRELAELTVDWNDVDRYGRCWSLYSACAHDEGISADLEKSWESTPSGQTNSKTYLAWRGRRGAN
jgi:serine/arginine repetitive matrix protein 2